MAGMAVLVLVCEKRILPSHGADAMPAPCLTQFSTSNKIHRIFNSLFRVFRASGSICPCQERQFFNPFCLTGPVTHICISPSLPE